MKYYEVAPNRIVRIGAATFTYASEQELSIGMVVTAPIGNTTAIGVITDAVSKPSYATKSITSIVEATPLPLPLIKATRWMAEYYATPLAQVLQTVLPAGVTKQRRARNSTPVKIVRNRTTIVFTKDQTSALQQLTAQPYDTVLLHGVTGSGKTAIYIERAKQVLTEGKSAIILVPEIALTSQLVAEFAHHFPDILLTHSRQTEAERHQTWREALTSEQPRVAIGPRSALFLPLKNVGLIAIDECHEPSYKQEKSPRYSALRVASILGKHHHAQVIFGSATPLISDYYQAEATQRPIISLPKPARENVTLPTTTTIDMTKRSNFTRHRFFSNTLLTKIEETLAKNEQVLLYHNRRGTAPTTLCEQCGWRAGCPRCFVPLTLHSDHHHLACHICNYTVNVPTSCPECGAADVIHKGVGTKLIESELTKLFPKVTIGRFDGDTDSDASLHERYQSVYDGSVQIIIGTQVVAKGLDLPHLRTVGVVQADAGLSLPDYMSSERTFQLLSQVVGRVGRSHHTTDVIIQSYQPQHPAIVDGIQQSYPEFYQRTLAQRRQTNFPPFCYLLKLTCTYKTEAAAIKNAKTLADTLKQQNLEIEVLGPTPAFYERVRDTYRWQLVVKATRRHTLIDTLAHLPAKNWQYELDPLSLL